MSIANLTEQEVQMRYPPNVIEWERKHGFARIERNGVLYVCAVRPIEEINESIRKENEERARRKGVKR